MRENEANEHPLYGIIMEELVELDRRDFQPKREERLARLVSLFSQPDEEKTEVIDLP